jgi:cobaltochelatase CobN
VQNLEKLHNEVSMPPSHEYIAFYLWLQKDFNAHAVMHIGTHGTQEWLTGKEAGLSDSDPTEALIGAMPNIYPYVMDDVGEGIQAKRRGMATIIDHMTPPFDVAGLNPDCANWRAAERLSRRRAEKPVAGGQPPESHQPPRCQERRVEGHEEDRAEIGSRHGRPGGISRRHRQQADAIRPAHLRRCAGGGQRNATARAVVSLDNTSTPEQKVKRIAQLEADIEQSRSWNWID